TFQRRDCLLLLVVDAQLVIDDSVVDNLQLVTEQYGPFQLLQQRSGKFLKRVGKDDDLGDRAQSAQEFKRAVQRTQGSDDSLNVGQFQSVLVEEVEPVFHEFVIIRLVARGAAGIGYAGLFGCGNPDLG